MMVTWKALNGWHINTAQCTKGAEQNIWRLVEEEISDSVKRTFQAYGTPLAMFTAFKYLGRVLTAADGEFPVVVGNLRKAREGWSRLARIIGW